MHGNEGGPGSLDSQRCLRLGLSIPRKGGRGLGSVVPGQVLEGCILAGFAWRLVVRRCVNSASALSHSFE